VIRHAKKSFIKFFIFNLKNQSEKKSDNMTDNNRSGLLITIIVAMVSIVAATILILAKSA
jgi:hypothetical protein